MSILLPRARLDLASKAWCFLGLSENEITSFQRLLDASKLEQRLREQYKSEVFPLVTTDIVPTEQALQLTSKEGLAPTDILVLVSKHSALLARLLINKSVYSKAQCFAVGSTAAQFFEDIDVFSPQKESGKALLGLDEFQAIEGKRVLIVKGEGGLDDIELGCCARGAEVEVLNLYRRQASTTVEQQLENNHEFDFVYGVSVFALEHLQETLKNKTEFRDISTLSLTAMSERIAKASINIGFSNISIEKV